MPPTPNTLRFALPLTTSPWANPLMAQAEAPERSDRRSPGDAYPDTVRMNALAVYAETGNQRMAADELGIPVRTVSGWVNDEATPRLVDDLRSTIRYNCGWRLAKMVQRGMDRLEEAWDKGAPHVLRDGRVIYVNESPKDAAITMSILLDKWMLISGAISQSAALVAGMDKISQQVSALGTALLPPDADPTPSPTSSPDPGVPVGENLVW